VEKIFCWTLGRKAGRRGAKQYNKKKVVSPKGKNDPRSGLGTLKKACGQAIGAGKEIWNRRAWRQLGAIGLAIHANRRWEKVDYGWRGKMVGKERYE